MKSHLLTLLLVLVGWNSMAASTTINAVLGDQSFIETYGFAPNTDTDDNLRIRTHLEFVEANLMKVSTENLAPTARANRVELLDCLHAYWMANKFPSPSIQYEGRKPCFIDSDGAICAVGYLIEMASGRSVAEYINSKYQFDYLLEMNDPLIDNWASEYGFSLDELAQIQPTYDWERPINPINPINPITPDPYIGPITYTISDQGPSKKERALQAELDTLRPIHASIVGVLDSTMNALAAQKEELIKLQDTHDKSIAAHKIEQAKSTDKIAHQKGIIYVLTGAFIALLGFTVFKQIKVRRPVGG